MQLRQHMAAGRVTRTERREAAGVVWRSDHLARRAFGDLRASGRARRGQVLDRRLGEKRIEPPRTRSSRTSAEPQCASGRQRSARSDWSVTLHRRSGKKFTLVLRFRMADLVAALDGFSGQFAAAAHGPDRIVGERR